MCRCRPVCVDSLEYLSKHIKSWSDRVDIEESQERMDRVIELLKTARILHDISIKIPRCTCTIVCRNVPAYLRTHLWEIAAGCNDDDRDTINEFLCLKTYEITKMLNGEHFARLNRERKAAKKAARVAAGLPPVQTPPPPSSSSDRNAPCLKGIDCTYPKCKWMHPEGRTIPKTTRKQACWFASSCPNRFTNCPFYHDPNRFGYDYSVVLKKKKVY